MSGTPFHDLVPIKARDIGGVTVQTANARQLWGALEVGTVFATWITRRIDRFGFVEGQDYVTELVAAGANSQNWEIVEDQDVTGGMPSKEYYITADMAKELSMVENNDRGREARRYFIACERLVKEMLGSNGLNAKVVGGIVKGIVHRELEDAMHRKIPEAIAVALAADQRVAVVEYVLPSEIVAKHDVPKDRRNQNFCKTVGDRLAAVAAEMEIPVKLCRVTRRRLFSVHVVDRWLANGGVTFIKLHKASLVSGQKILPFPKQRKPKREDAA